MGTKRLVQICVVSLVTAGCGVSTDTSLPLAPSAVVDPSGANAQATATATATGANLAADPAFTSIDPTLVSTCAGTVARSGGVWWPRFTECVVITPRGSSYALTNDPGLQFTVKRGLITHVTFVIDDVVGGEGIQHETDPIPVTPVAFGGAGWVFHIHADNVPVYRLSGHLSGKRVAMIGTISIGDVVYF